MLKKLTSLLLVCVLMLGLTGCSNDDSQSGDKPAKNPSIEIKTVDDFEESTGLVKYFTIEDKKFSLPETVGEYANYLSQLGEVTLNDTGKAVEDETLPAGGISSMMAYLNVETEDGENQHFLVRYVNNTDDEISVAEATVTQIEVKYDPYSNMDYEKVFNSIEVVTSDYTFEMDGKTKLKKFYDKLGGPERETDGRLEYSDDLGYKYTFDCCNENRNGLFRGFIIKYPTE